MLVGLKKQQTINYETKIGNKPPTWKWETAKWGQNRPKYSGTNVFL